MWLSEIIEVNEVILKYLSMHARSRKCLIEMHTINELRRIQIFDGKIEHLLLDVSWHGKYVSFASEWIVSITLFFNFCHDMDIAMH